MLLGFSSSLSADFWKELSNCLKTHVCSASCKPEKISCIKFLRKYESEVRFKSNRETLRPLIDNHSQRTSWAALRISSTLLGEYFTRYWKRLSFVSRNQEDP
ncbi:hypothetical protein PanWU01x14_174090 [Parasponia andersonii]|uniref:Uncharacterized protein n=1 Tax=Parasponia andersonii TaxID=3476 RepID=A0A2P5C8Z0_PARAD|nr:hypothetical protein PanWU01x14_174090 [Parasponia andersonii]